MAELCHTCKLNLPFNSPDSLTIPLCQTITLRVKIYTRSYIPEALHYVIFLSFSLHQSLSLSHCRFYPLFLLSYIICALCIVHISVEPQLLVAPFNICATPLWEAGLNCSIYIVVFKLWQPCIFNGPTLRLCGDA